MKLISSQFIQIRSSGRQVGEQIHDFSVQVPHDDIKCKQNQLMKVSVQSFDLYHTWTYINAQNKTVVLLNNTTMQSTTITLPDGNYTYKALASQLSSMYTGWSVSWVSSTNKFLFSFTEPHSMFVDLVTFPKQACEPLGFMTQTYTTNASLQILSVNVLRPTLSERINVHIDNLTPYDKVNLTNAVGGKTTTSTGILSIINNFAPFDIIKYESMTDLYGFFVSEKSVEKINISLRDIDGSLLTFIDSDYNIVLRFDTYEDDTTLDDSNNIMISSLKDIREYLRLIFVSNNMNTQ